MKLSRERKFFVLVCALAVVALVVDRAVLGDAGADDSPAAGDGAESLLVSRSSPGGASARSGNLTQPKNVASGSPSAATISAMLQEMAERNRRQLDQTPDAFHPARGWGHTTPTVDVVVHEPGPRGPDPVVEHFARRKLMSLTSGGRRGAGAMIDGRILHIGESLDGFTLTSVDAQSALFEGRGVQVRLGLGGEARVGRLAATAELSGR